jgi:transposase
MPSANRSGGVGFNPVSQKPQAVQTAATLSGWREAFLAAGEASLATRPLDSEVLESNRLKARLGEMLLERELLEAKIAALEARDPRPLPRRRSRR